MYTAKEIVTEVMEARDLKKQDMARLVGWEPAKFSKKAMTGNLRADEFLYLLDQSGVDVNFVYRDTGEPVRPREVGKGDTMIRMVDGVFYSTGTSRLLFGSYDEEGRLQYSNGVAVELYVTRGGAYFLAEYNEIPGIRGRIIPIDHDSAVKFLTDHGGEELAAQKQAEGWI